MAYPQANARRRRRSRYRTLPKWLSGRRLAALIALLILTPLTVYGVRVVGGLSKLTGSNPGAVLGCIIKVKCDSTLASSTKRINIALYGYGGTGHDGAYLTDSIMVVSIQPRPGQTAQVAEISVPRDWMVPIDAAGGKPYYGRINEAYSDGQSGGPVNAPRFKGDDHGGGKLADQTLSNVLGIPIDHFVGLDFQAFQAAVDSVGGVDVNVPDSFTDDQYPHGECDKGDCAYMTVHFTKGMQHMDGARALIFARSRHAYDNPSEASNFARNRRQQLILNALKAKVLSVGGIGKLPDLLSALGDNVITDLGIADANALYDMVKGVDSSRIVHVSIDDTNFLYECGYPQNCGAAYEYAHDKTYASLQHYLSDVFPDPAVVAEHAPVTFLDGTGAGAGAATRWSALMTPIGFTATDGGPTKRTALTQVIDGSGGKDSRTAQWLANYFGVSVQTPATGTASTAADTTSTGVTVILGQDSERAWSGNGKSYPSNPADNSAPSAVAPASAQQPATGTQTQAPTQAPRRTPAPPPPPTAPPPSPTPIVCLPPACHKP
ncbi:MAG TPA: LCP family protein [Candidatus Angelobacter sp.]|jgi:LCP family protein required for cell wall assembly|nr:LCP family protein [Candidatus Angelobacter sp.]